ncbi:MAG: hypothetical protein K0R51_63 [Cytophagaceae bacterium]|jgi:hypothetical protein|nr:hypothetical protein [Cytophagaceae bacterium]
MRLTLIIYSIALTLGALSFGAVTGPCSPPLGPFVLVPLLFLASTFLLAKEVHAWLNGKNNSVLLSIHALVLLSCIGICLWFFWSVQR